MWRYWQDTLAFEHRNLLSYQFSVHLLCNGLEIGGETIHILYDFKVLLDQPIIRIILVSHYFPTV